MMVQGNMSKPKAGHSYQVTPHPPTCMVTGKGSQQEVAFLEKFVGSRELEPSGGIERAGPTMEKMVAWTGADV